MTQDQLIQNFTSNFKKGSSYSSQEIKQFLNKIGSHYNSQNPVAFSYNQWNAGMQGILPLFLYESRGEHIFLGPDANYEGYAFHRPKGNKKGFIKIGVWNGDNTFTYIDKNIKSFADWKRNLTRL
jgi:hypothetical protein